MRLVRAIEVWSRRGVWGWERASLLSGWSITKTWWWSLMRSSSTSTYLPLHHHLIIAISCTLSSTAQVWIPIPLSNAISTYIETWDILLYHASTQTRYSSSPRLDLHTLQPTACLRCWTPSCLSILQHTQPTTNINLCWRHWCPLVPQVPSHPCAFDPDAAITAYPIKRKRSRVDVGD